MRYFNTSGPNRPSEHYNLSRLAWIEKGKDLVLKQQYITIRAPFHTGKSTYIMFLADDLRQLGYQVCYINFENFKDGTLTDFIVRLNHEFSNQWGIVFNEPSISGIFRQIERVKNEKWVLVIDEVDKITPTILSELLPSIRSVFHSRSTHSLKSVILVSINDILQMKPDLAIPFNIADNLDVPYFTDAETLELLGQHEQETGQLFGPTIKQKISEITANQPGLVNGFAAQLVSNCVGKPVIEYADYLAVEKNYLKFSLDKSIANIINKGKKYQAFVQNRLFTETNVQFQIQRDSIYELYVNGIIMPDQNGFVAFRVPLYRKCLHAAFFPYTNGESKRIGSTINIDEYYTPNGGLNIDKVIENYKKYALRRKFRYFKEEDKHGKVVNLKEATLVYSFETYLNAFLSMVDGKTYLEAHTCVGRTDLIISIGKEEFVVEAKVYSDIVKFRKGKIQLAQYAKSLSLSSAFYLVFVESEANNPTVLEEELEYEGVLIKTHLVPYNLELDF
jgi:AAA-like domain